MIHQCLRNARRLFTSQSQADAFEHARKLYAEASLQSKTLQERYSPTSLLSREEKTRLTARRVGLDMPKLYDEKEDGAKTEEGKKDT